MRLQVTVVVRVRTENGWVTDRADRKQVLPRILPRIPTIPYLTRTMSQTSPSVASRSNYQIIFDSALEAYKQKTGNDLISDPLFQSIENCQSPDAILAILQEQILEPGQAQSSRNKLTMWLDPTVNILNAVSATTGGFGGLVSLKEYEMTRPGSAV
jgi:hypothetical protein